jgi:glycine/D-amino acid oxidase-like deaminating enzyme
VTDAPEVAVVGAGILGLSAAHALLEMDVPVRVYEAAVPGKGQSAGESRIFRHAHDDRRMVERARRSRAIWDDWGQRFGMQLVSSDGAVAIGAPVERRLEVLDRVGGVPARAIGAGELAERMPLLADYSGPAMLDEGGGAIRTSAAISALAARLAGAIVTGEVLSIRSLAGGSVEVRSIGDCAEYTSLIVCAGRQTARLAEGVGLSLPVRLAAHVRLTFDVAATAPPRVACLQDGSGEFGEVGVYATPLPDNRRYALGLSQSVEVGDGGALGDAAQLASLADRARAYVERALPGLDPEPTEFVHCWVTDLPWSEDGLAVWSAEGILFAAGHNLFKQAPWLGRELARAAVGDGMDPELTPEARLGEPSS